MPKKKTTTTATKNKGVSYTYLNPDNITYIKKLALKYNQSVSYCMDKVIESVRFGKKIAIEDNVPKYVLQAREFEKKRKTDKRKL